MAPILRRGGSRPRSFFFVLFIGGVLIGATATAAAAGPGTSTTTPFSFTGTNPCTGDAIAGSGKLHLLITDNLSSSGMVQFHIEATFSGLQAVTTFPVAGKRYVVISGRALPSARPVVQTRTLRTPNHPVGIGSAAWRLGLFRLR
jgi:hypothetical protein